MKKQNSIEKSLRKHHPGTKGPQNSVQVLGKMNRKLADISGNEGLYKKLRSQTKHDIKEMRKNFK